MKRRLLMLVALCLCPTASLGAQSSARLVASIEPDSVRVGELFTVRIVVVQERSRDVEFPALMELPEALEQLGPVQIRSMEGGTEWRAEYPLVAWRADTVAISAIEVQLGPAGSRPRLVAPPELVVRSVLPPETAGLELRDARPFLRLRYFPWWLIALAAAAAGLAWWIWRGRNRAGHEAALVPAGPGAVALRDFERLRETWIAGRVSGDGFYDDYEATLRRYAQATRGWSRGRELIQLGGRDSALFAAFRHSVLARFARVRMGGDRPLEDIVAGAAFVRSEMPREAPAPSEPLTGESTRGESDRAGSASGRSARGGSGSGESISSDGAA